jgi:hypothetical protein
MRNEQTRPLTSPVLGSLSPDLRYASASITMIG